MWRSLRRRKQLLLMTAHPRLEPVLDDLDVVYMGSPDPQRLNVIVETAGPGELPLTLWAVVAWVQAMARGLGSGGTFEPALATRSRRLMVLGMVVVFMLCSPPWTGCAAPIRSSTPTGGIACGGTVTNSWVVGRPAHPIRVSNGVGRHVAL